MVAMPLFEIPEWRFSGGLLVVGLILAWGGPGWWRAIEIWMPRRFWGTVYTASWRRTACFYGKR